MIQQIKWDKRTQTHWHTCKPAQHVGVFYGQINDYCDNTYE